MHKVWDLIYFETDSKKNTKFNTAVLILYLHKENQVYLKKKNLKLEMFDLKAWAQ